MDRRRLEATVTVVDLLDLRDHQQPTLTNTQAHTYAHRHAPNHDDTVAFATEWALEDQPDDEG